MQKLKKLKEKASRALTTERKASLRSALSMVNAGAAFAYTMRRKMDPLGAVLTVCAGAERVLKDPIRQSSRLADWVAVPESEGIATLLINYGLDTIAHHIETAEHKTYIFFRFSGIEVAAIVWQATWSPGEPLSLNKVSSLRIHEADFSKSKEVLAVATDAAWAAAGSDVEIRLTRSEEVLVARSNPERLYESTDLDEIWSDVQPFLNAGKPQFLMLYGDPGSGKSTIARGLLDRVGGRRVRVSARDFLTCGAQIDSVLALHPTGMIVDDIDRASEATTLVLEAVDSLRRSGFRFLVLTANYVGELPDACLRPGRIDRVYQLDLTRETTAAYLTSLGLSGTEVFDTLVELPVAYAHAYAEAMEVGAASPAKLKSLVEAFTRVQAVGQKQRETHEPGD